MRLLRDTQPEARRAPGTTMDHVARQAFPYMPHRTLPYESGLAAQIHGTETLAAALMGDRPHLFERRALRLVRAMPAPASRNDQMRPSAPLVPVRAPETVAGRDRGIAFVQALAAVRLRERPESRHPVRVTLVFAMPLARATRTPSALDDSRRHRLPLVTPRALP